MQLVLNGILSYFTNDKYVFTFSDDGTKNKLERNCSGNNRPYDNSTFTVHMNNINLTEFIGKQVAVRVDVIHYKFKVKDRFITGTKLKFIDINQS